MQNCKKNGDLDVKSLNFVPKIVKTPIVIEIPKVDEFWAKTVKNQIGIKGHIIIY